MADHTPMRTVRVPTDLWRAAQAKAAEEHTTVSDHIREDLEEWTRQ